MLIQDPDPSSSTGISSTLVKNLLQGVTASSPHPNPEVF